MLTDLTPDQRRAIETAVKATRRSYSMPPEDRFQEAAVGVLSAKLEEGREARSTQVYLYLRAVGHIRDALRREMAGDMQAQRKSRHPGASEDRGPPLIRDADASIEALHAPSDPAATLAVKKVLVAVAGISKHSGLIAQRLIEGRSGKEIAAECGLTPSRVSQVRRQINQCVERLL